MILPKKISSYRWLLNNNTGTMITPVYIIEEDLQTSKEKLYNLIGESSMNLEKLDTLKFYCKKPLH